jgi:hypothetical protein
MRSTAYARPEQRDAAELNFPVEPAAFGLLASVDTVQYDTVKPFLAEKIEKNLRVMGGRGAIEV